MTGANLRPDPAGIFDSDLHRRVLAHLPVPGSEVGWTLPALLVRLSPDKHTPLPPVDENGFADTAAGLEALTELVEELKADGLVKRHAGDVYTQSTKGHDLLVGPIADEPPEGAEVEGPAIVIGEPTPIGGGS